ncbi:MAG: protoporphyrinogen oxidase HemJ [Epsilonproteobacteria bacterium]|nr:protoporphyrinogen oxidase HemJ [Campylobacterota bacterium]
MEYYSWILSFHIVSFMSWMAMLFYLPRLFVYHREYNDKAEFLEVVQIQEFKLYKYIGVPAMWATVLSGGLMVALNIGLLATFWIYAKLFTVVLLIAYSYSLNYLRLKLKANSEFKSGKFFRFYNEIPTILAIFIVIFVIVKPF